MTCGQVSILSGIHGKFVGVRSIRALFSPHSSSVNYSPSTSSTRLSCRTLLVLRITPRDLCRVASRRVLPLVVFALCLYFHASSITISSLPLIELLPPSSAKLRLFLSSSFPFPLVCHHLSISFFSPTWTRFFLSSQIFPKPISFFSFSTVTRSVDVIFPSFPPAFSFSRLYLFNLL